MDRRAGPRWGPEGADLGAARCPDRVVSARLPRHGLWVAQDGSPARRRTGWRVVAPFMRGIRAVVDSGRRQLSRRRDDGRRLARALGSGRHRCDVVIGHDWGAMAATGLAAMPDSPFTKAVIMSVPVSAGIPPQGRRRRARAAGRTAGASTAAQLVHLLLPIASAARAFRVLGAADVVAAVVAGISAPTRICATSTPRSGHPRAGARRWGPYRATLRNTRPPAAVCRTEPAVDRGAHVAEPCICMVATMVA